MIQSSNEEQARLGGVIARFLGDEDVRTILREIDERYIAEWKDPNSTPESRDKVWHKSQALHDLVEEMQGAVANGMFAREHLQRQERQVSK